MYSKDLERLARSFFAQKLERAYIRHYLMETYQLDAKTTDEVLEKVSPSTKVLRGKPAAEPTAGGSVKRQRFY